MRIISIEVSGIGGLADGKIVFPRTSLVAVAGANGTGKSKLLSSALGMWSSVLPTPRQGEASKASIEVEFTEFERNSIQEAWIRMGWGSVKIPQSMFLIAERDDFRGFTRSSIPGGLRIEELLSNEEFLKQNHSLNPMYLPAERRLLPSNVGGIDLGQLDELISFRKTAESRSAAQNYGRLDDQEFEQFAKALCVSDKLEDDTKGSSSTPLSRIEWPEFLENVNFLLAPKKLLPLTKSRPDQLRIELSNGDTHSVPDLSSGERQALVIISRVLRAGAGHTLVMIDEPDAYLHPNLSQRLIEVLERGIGDDGQLIVATHSPAILDRLAPSAILRLSHESPAEVVADEEARIELYRNTGFRASALTQSELLVVTEGELDDALLRALYPQLSRASLQRGNGREGVLQRVRHLAEYSVPIVGMVDGDVSPPTIPTKISNLIHVLPTADIEGAFLSDDAALNIMIDKHLINSSYNNLEKLKALRDKLYYSKKENVVAEIAKNKLRPLLGSGWPGSRMPNAVSVLKDSLQTMSIPTNEQFDNAVAEAEAEWSANIATPWNLVRGKYISSEFNSMAGLMKNSVALLESVAHERPGLHALRGFEEKITATLGP